VDCVHWWAWVGFVGPPGALALSTAPHVHASCQRDTGKRTPQRGYKFGSRKVTFEAAPLKF